MPGTSSRSARRTVSEEIFEVGRSLHTGEASFMEAFGKPTSLESDLLRIGSAVFAVDRAAQRGEREDFARNIELCIPVVNFERLSPTIPVVEKVLRLLSHDGWTLTLLPANGDCEEDDVPMPIAVGKTLLFSGGLDSLAAALEFSDQTTLLGLVSHRTRNRATISTQDALVAELEKDGRAVVHYPFFVSSSDAGTLDHDVEATQRTRSFLFLVLAALVARRTGRREILYMAENGQMAIHLPLTQARIGAFSTHTAHPDVLLAMQGFLSAALGQGFAIENPYLLRTKREVVKIVRDKRPDLVPLASSCWKNSRVAGGHCGECVPCFVRRIAIESLGKDGTTYKRDVWAEDFTALPPGDTGRRNLADLAEFRLLLAQQSPAELLLTFPELRSNSFDGDAAIDMYKRWADEAAQVWGRYPTLRRLLS